MTVLQTRNQDRTVYHEQPVDYQEFQPSYAPTVPTVTTTTRRYYSPTVPAFRASTPAAFSRRDQSFQGSTHRPSQGEGESLDVPPLPSVLFPPEASSRDDIKSVGLIHYSQKAEDRAEYDDIEGLDSIGLARSKDERREEVDAATEKKPSTTTSTTTPAPESTTQTKDVFIVTPVFVAEENDTRGEDVVVQYHSTRGVHALQDNSSFSSTAKPENVSLRVEDSASSSTVAPDVFSNEVRRLWSALEDCG